MLKAYLAAITRNKAKSALRKARAEEPLEDDLIQISIPNQPERKILLSELRDITRAAVDSLGEPDREIFQRHYFLYQKTGDIARALGLKDATVRVKLARGRKRLKDYLEERGFGCEDTHFWSIWASPTKRWPCASPTKSGSAWAQKRRRRTGAASCLALSCWQLRWCWPSAQRPLPLPDSA